jgi:hypothetical protein
VDIVGDDGEGIRRVAPPWADARGTGSGRAETGRFGAPRMADDTTLDVAPGQFPRIRPPVVLQNCPHHEHVVDYFEELPATAFSAVRLAPLNTSGDGTDACKSFLWEIPEWPRSGDVVPVAFQRRDRVDPAALTEATAGAPFHLDGWGAVDHSSVGPLPHSARAIQSGRVYPQGHERGHPRPGRRRAWRCPRRRAVAPARVRRAAQAGRRPHGRRAPRRTPARRAFKSSPPDR